MPHYLIVFIITQCMIRIPFGIIAKFFPEKTYISLFTENFIEQVIDFDDFFITNLMSPLYFNVHCSFNKSFAKSLMLLLCQFLVYEISLNCFLIFSMCSKEYCLLISKHIIVESSNKPSLSTFVFL